MCVCVCVAYFVVHREFIRVLSFNAELTFFMQRMTLPSSKAETYLNLLPPHPHKQKLNPPTRKYAETNAAQLIAMRRGATQ